MKYFWLMESNMNVFESLVDLYEIFNFTHMFTYLSEMHALVLDNRELFSQ